MYCASSLQIQVSLSISQVIYGIFQSFIILFTVFAIFQAIKILWRESILPKTTKILFFAMLFYGAVHGVAFSTFVLTIFNRNFIIPKNTTCLEIPSGEDCSLVIRGISTGISGNILIQTCLCLDRLLATIFGLKYAKTVPGFVFLIIVIIGSQITFPILQNGQILNEPQLYCIMWPTKMAESANNFLAATFYLSIFNFILNISVMRYNQVHRKKLHFKMLERYQQIETFQSTKMVSYILSCELISMIIYSGGVWLMRQNQKDMDYVVYINIIVWFYTHPISCALVPVLIIFSSWNLKRQRSAKINTMTYGNKETGEQHIQKLRNTWA